MKKKHESYGMIKISRFSCNKSEFYGSDISHMGGISISISKSSVKRDLHGEWFHPEGELIRVELSANQYVDAITSGMNTEGVPCTITRYNNKSIPQISHIEDKKELFVNEMAGTQDEYMNKIQAIIDKLEGGIGKRKSDEIKFDLEVLANHISSNTNFVLKSFNEAMENTVTEAKHSISNYIDHKVHTMGVEGIKDKLHMSIESRDSSKGTNKQ